MVMLVPVLLLLQVMLASRQVPSAAGSVAAAVRSSKLSAAADRLSVAWMMLSSTRSKEVGLGASCCASRDACDSRHQGGTLSEAYVTAVTAECMGI
jgi:hypothetical protein